MIIKIFGGRPPLLVVVSAQRRYLRLEIIERLEAPVDRSETQIGDLIERPQRAQNGQADFVRRHLTQATRSNGLFHALSQDRELVLGDWPPLAGPPDPVDDLVPVERLGRAAAL